METKVLLPLIARLTPYLACVVLLQGCVSDQGGVGRPSALVVEAAHGSSDARRVIEGRLGAASVHSKSALSAELLALLQEPGLGASGQRWVFEMLSRVADADSVSTLLRLGREDRLRTQVGELLVSLPGGALEIELLRVLSGEDRSAIRLVVPVVGRRHLQAAVPALTTLARGGDEDLAGAALAALGEIGGEPAYRTLRALRLSPTLMTLRTPALVSALAWLAGNRSSDPALRSQAAETCRSLLQDSSLESSLSASVMASLARLDGAQAAPEILSALSGRDVGPRKAALDAVVQAQDSSLSAVIASRWPSLPSSARRDLLRVLEAASDPTSLSLAWAALEDPEPDLREQGSRILARCGTEADAARLLTVLEQKRGDAPEHAAALAAFHLSSVDALLRARIGTAPSSLAAVLLEISANRGDRTIFAPACSTLESGLASEAALRGSALAAAGRLARPEDLPRLLGLLPKLRMVSEIRLLEDALRRLAPASPTPQSLCALSSGLLNVETDQDRRQALLVCLAGLDTPEALAIVSRDLGSSDPRVFHDCVSLLANSGQPAQAAMLLDRLKDASAAEKTLLVKGLMRLISLCGDRPTEQRAALLSNLLVHVSDPTDREWVLSQLKQVSPGLTRALEGR